MKAPKDTQAGSREEIPFQCQALLWEKAEHTARSWPAGVCLECLPPGCLRSASNTCPCALPAPCSCSWVCLDPSETLQTPAAQTLPHTPASLGSTRPKASEPSGGRDGHLPALCGSVCPWMVEDSQPFPTLYSASVLSCCDCQMAAAALSGMTRPETRRKAVSGSPPEHCVLSAITEPDNQCWLQTALGKTEENYVLLRATLSATHPWG